MKDAMGILGIGFENKSVKEIIAYYEAMIEIMVERDTSGMDLENYILIMQLKSLYEKTVELLKRLDAIDTAEKENAPKGEEVKNC